MKKLSLTLVLALTFSIKVTPAEMPGQYITDAIMPLSHCDFAVDIEDFCPDAIRAADSFINEYGFRVEPNIQQYVKDVTANRAKNQTILEDFRKKIAKAAQAEKIRKAKPGVKIGDRADFVIKNSSWGKPNSINRTTNKYGTHEQWVYGDGNYLYFENGVLTSIQN